MLMESRLVGQLVVHLGCRVVQLLNHLNAKRPLWWDVLSAACSGDVGPWSTPPVCSGPQAPAS